MRAYFVLFLQSGLIWMLLPLWMAYLIEGKKVNSRVGECILTGIDSDEFYCYPSGSTCGKKEDDDDDDDDDDELTSAISCVDSNTECTKWADKNECQNNPRYMLANCRRSCNTCVDGHRGVIQVAPDPLTRDKVIHRLSETAKYVYDITSRNYRAFKTCDNKDPLCTHWAVSEHCENNQMFMQLQCPAACRVCHMIP